MKLHLQHMYKLYIAILLLLTSCTEEITFETQALESALVVEATITNEEKSHVITLSRSYAFEAEGPIPETGAQVKIETSSGNILFEEEEPGRYVSANAFSAQPNESYELFITTSNGTSYASSTTQLTPATPIGELYAVRETTDMDEDGVSIKIDSYDPTGNSKFYRFEYEESYKIIAPKWDPEDLVVVDPMWPYCIVELVPKTEEKRTCYGSEISKKIIIGNTTELDEDRLDRFVVRQISNQNYIITHRYSILVRQFIQSQEAHSYYEALKEFNDEGSIFSQDQPGFFSGNISAVNNPSEKVIGFFEASFMSSERLFFDYEELFPNDPKPPYVSTCIEYRPVRDQGHPTDQCGSLINALLNYEIAYVRPSEEPETIYEGPYWMTPIVCGDCTILGSNVKPDFWID